MLQNNDALSARQDWMRLLACAPLDVLESWALASAVDHAVDNPQASFVWLRNPQTGLVMVRGRVGGSGDRFNLGEMTVTRCALRLPGGAHGVAYVQGRSHRKAELAALADALLQTPSASSAVVQGLIAPLRARAAAEAGTQRRKAQATRVDFFTLARGED